MTNLSETQARRNFLLKASAGAVGLSTLGVGPSVAHAAGAATALYATFTLQSTTNGFLSGYITVPGPQHENDVTLIVHFRVNPSLGVDATFPALFHVRQAVNAGIPVPTGPVGAPDQFSTQLVTYEYPIEGKDTLGLVLRLRRVDQNSGWGQSLRIDTLLKLKTV